MIRTLIAPVTFFAAMTIALPAFAQDLNVPRRVSSGSRSGFLPPQQNQSSLLGGAPRLKPSDRASQPEISPAQKVRMAQAQLSNATSAKDKTAAKESLTEALGESFDLDIKGRKAQLESIHQRLAEMEAQLKKRVAGRDFMFDLRLQVLLNNANGLGWSDAPENGFGDQGRSWDDLDRQRAYRELNPISRNRN